MVNKLKIIIFVLVLAFYGVILAQKMNLPAASDLPRQIKIGETILGGNFKIFYQNIYSYTEPEYRFFNHHWLSGVIFYTVNLLTGFTGLVILKIVVMLIAFSILFRTALQKANFWLVALCSLPTILILAERVDVRPEIFSYLFIALYLYILSDFKEGKNLNRPYWLVPLQMLWVNMHVFFSIGIMIMAGFLFEAIVLHWRSWWKSMYARRLAIIFGLMILASCVNPRGVMGVLYRYPPNFPVTINEFQSLFEVQKGTPLFSDIATAVFLPAVVLLALSFLLTIFRKETNIFLLLASAATAYIGFTIVRGISLFGVIFLLAASANFTSVFEKLKKWLRSESSRVYIYTSCVFIVGIGAIYLFGIIRGPQFIIKFGERGLGLTHDSTKAAEFFKEQNLHGPIFNDANSGSYLIYFLYPKEKVFVDNRFGDAYSPSFFRDVYFPMIRNEQTWHDLKDYYNLNVIFFFHYFSGLDDRLFLMRRINDPEWALIYTDSYNVILVRNNKENENVIKKFGITKANALERLKPLLYSSNVDDRTAAGDLLNIIGLNDLALASYFDTALKWPERYRIWMIMGEMESSKSNPTDLVLSTMFLERAIQRGGGVAETYYFLGLSYYKLNEIESAYKALEKSLALDSSRSDAQILFKKVQELRH